MKKLMILCLLLVCGRFANAQGLTLQNLSTTCDVLLQVKAQSSPSYPASCVLESAMITLPAGTTLTFPNYSVFQATYPFSVGTLPAGETVTWDVVKFQVMGSGCTCAVTGSSISNISGACGVPSSWAAACITAGSGVVGPFTQFYWY